MRLRSGFETGDLAMEKMPSTLLSNLNPAGDSNQVESGGNFQAAVEISQGISAVSDARGFAELGDNAFSRLEREGSWQVTGSKNGGERAERSYSDGVSNPSYVNSNRAFTSNSDSFSVSKNGRKSHSKTADTVDGSDNEYD